MSKKLWNSKGQLVKVVLLTNQTAFQNACIVANWKSSCTFSKFCKVNATSPLVLACLSSLSIFNGQENPQLTYVYPVTLSLYSIKAVWKKE